MNGARGNANCWGQMIGKFAAGDQIFTKRGAMFVERRRSGDGLTNQTVVKTMVLKAMPTAPVTGQFEPPATKVRRPSCHANCLALFLCLTEAPIARADAASCLAKVSSYVTELDQLLSKERNWITPYLDLNERYFPLRDCEGDALLDVVRGSSFIRSISYASRVNEYYIHFSSDEVSVSFGYQVSEKKSNFASATWTHK